MQLKNVTVYVGCGVTYSLQEYGDNIQVFKKGLNDLPGITLVDTEDEGADIMIFEISLWMIEQLDVTIQRSKVSTVFLLIKGNKQFTDFRVLCKNYPHASLIEYEKNLSERIPGIVNLIEYVRMFKLKNP